MILIERITVKFKNKRTSERVFEVWGDHLNAYQTRVIDFGETIASEFETLSAAYCDCYREVINHIGIYTNEIVVTIERDT